jgi:hypothetical protein
MERYRRLSSTPTWTSCGRLTPSVTSFVPAQQEPGHKTSANGNPNFSPAVRAAEVPWLGTTTPTSPQQCEQRKSRGWAPQRPQAHRRRARYRRAPSRHRCLRHSGRSSRATAAAAAAAAHAGGRRACAGLDWTDQVVSPDSSRPPQTCRALDRRQGGEEPHQQVQNPTLSAVAFIFGLGTS